MDYVIKEDGAPILLLDVKIGMKILTLIILSIIDIIPFKISLKV